MTFVAKRFYDPPPGYPQTQFTPTPPNIFTDSPTPPSLFHISPTWLQKDFTVFNIASRHFKSGNFQLSRSTVKGGPRGPRTAWVIDILGAHARLQAPHTGADCLHPMNPPPSPPLSPTRHARAVCAASAGFCAHFAALAQPLGA